MSRKYSDDEILGLNSPNKKPDNEPKDMNEVQKKI